MNKIIFIAGPTAVGKTSLAIKLAKKVRGEIISADSMQAYRGMDIISQNPTPAEQRKIPHHLISFLNPRAEYSAAKFSKKAKKIIENIIERKKIPIVVGGSGLYIKVLIDGIFPSSGKDEKVRKKLERLAAKKGRVALHKRLKKIDPLAASKIHPNDLKRVIRALEIYEVEKRTKTSLKKDTKGIKDKYDVGIFGLRMERASLYKRINDRVDAMFKKGLVREVKKLSRMNLSLASRQALGLRQVKGYLDGEYALEKAKDILKRDTRRFAKKQLTWFRADKRIIWLDLDTINEKEALSKIWKELYS